jgi:hypothetical protein
MARDLDLPGSVLFYAQIVSSFMSGDLEKMQELVIGIEAALKDEVPSIAADIKDLVYLRLKVRAKNITTADIEKVYSRTFFDVLDAEKFFVAARGWEIMGDELSSINAYLKASAIYKKLECPKKSLRAFYSSVVAESRLTPYKNFVGEYQAIINMSRELGDNSFAGAAMNMLSREYQIVGLSQEAMNLANDSLEYLATERGSYLYYHSLLHKAHLLIERNMPVQATILLLECKLAAFPEVTAARVLLECAIDKDKTWPIELEKDLHPTFRERIPDLLINSQKQDLPLQEGPTSLEFKLLKLLWNGPIGKWDLIERLYPGEADSYAIENRFKNLVARLRKKYPEVLSFKEGNYFIQNKTDINLSTIIGGPK